MPAGSQGNRMSSGRTGPSEKRKAAGLGEMGDSGEQAKKNLKFLKDKIVALTEKNVALAQRNAALAQENADLALAGVDLTKTIRDMRKESEGDNASHEDDSADTDRDGEDNDNESGSSDGDDSPDGHDSESSDERSSDGHAPEDPAPCGLPPKPWPPAPLVPGPPQMNTVQAYQQPVADMLISAQRKFECLLFVEDAFPRYNKQLAWSFRCWKEVCLEYQAFFMLSPSMGRLITEMCTHSKMGVLSRVRPVVSNLFKARKLPYRQQKDVRRDQAALADRFLRGNAFYFVGGVVGRRRLLSETIFFAIQKAYFASSESCAANNRSRFCPISLASVSLVCTIIEHCLREWASGVPRELNGEIEADRYRAHLYNHSQWKRENKELAKFVLRYIAGEAFTFCGPPKTASDTAGYDSEETLQKMYGTLEKWDGYDTEEEA